MASSAVKIQEAAFAIEFATRVAKSALDSGAKLTSRSTSTRRNTKDTKAELLRFGDRPALQAGWHGRIGWIDEHYSPPFVRRSIRVRACASRRDAVEPQ